MAITTLDGLIGGTKGAGFIYKNATKPAVAAANWASYWAAGTIPAAGTLTATVTVSGTIPDETTTGAMAFADPAGGATSYIMGATINSTISGTVLVYDRVYSAGSFTPAATYPTFVGTSLTRPGDGAGLEVWGEISTVIGTVNHALTINYTDQSGNVSAVGTMTLVSAGPVARMYPMTFAAGDSGIRKITSMSGSGTPTGAFNVLVIRPLLRVGVVANVPARLGIPECGLRPLYTDSCVAVAFYNPTGTTAPDIHVHLDLTTG
jgi:hypothetical protein